MDVISTCPLGVASIVWQPQAGAWARTVICKATYRLEPVESPLSDVQEAPNENDNYWNDDETRSLYAPSDLVPFKPRGDVLLVGHAFAPQRQPVRSLAVRLVVGEVDKAIEVWCDRSFGQDGRMLEGQRFVKMPLRYERAAGGPDTTNPVGLRFDAPPDAYGMVAIPNLQPPGVYVAQRGDTFAPIGLGPIAPSWPSRRERLGARRASWSNEALYREPLPTDIDYKYLNSAPQDQQVKAIHDNERIILENLHPEHARLVTSLPGHRPRAIALRSGTPLEEIVLRCDTLWIDTDLGICTLTWRGQVRLEHPEQQGKVVVGIEMAGQRLSYADILSHAGGWQDAFGVNSDGKPPERSSEPDDSSSTIACASDVAIAPALPFLPTANGGESSAGAGAQARAAAHSSISSWLPFAPTPTIGPAPIVPTVMPSNTHATAAPPVRLPDAPMPAPPTRVKSPWSIAVTDPAERVSEPSKLPSMVEAEAPPFSAVKRLAIPSSPITKDEGQERKAAAPRAAGGASFKDASSALAASNAAAASSEARTASSEAGRQAPRAIARPADRPGDRELIELLWFEQGLAARLRKATALREAFEARSSGAWLKGGETPREVTEPKERSDVLRALTCARPLESEKIGESLADSRDDEGYFTPPLVVAAGELFFCFDEQETLKATVSVVTSLIGTDRRLKDTVDAAAEVSTSTWRVPNEVIATHLARIRDTFLQVSRPLTWEALQACIDRILLEERRYPKRTLLGDDWIRSMLVLPSAKAPIPAYLPWKFAKSLPLIQRLPVKVIAELRPRQDELEAHSEALAVLAFSRVLPTPKLP